MTKRVLITGCSTGVGRALVVTLVQHGYEVIATARDATTLTDLPAVARLALDVTSEDSVLAAVAQAGRIDILVNNAGIGLWGPVEAVSERETQLIFETNVFGPLRLLRAVLPQMRARREGLIMQISSAAGRVTGPLIGHYAATKHALEVLSEALRIEAALFGVSVTIVELGAVESAFSANRRYASSPAYEPLIEHQRQRIETIRSKPATSAEVAADIVPIIASAQPRLRYAVTADAKAIITRRQAQSDDVWEQETLAALPALYPA